jgi:hypothetical protein
MSMRALTAPFLPVSTPAPIGAASPSGLCCGTFSGSLPGMPRHHTLSATPSRVNAFAAYVWERTPRAMGAGGWRLPTPRRNIGDGVPIAAIAPTGHPKE